MQLWIASQGVGAIIAGGAQIASAPSLAPVPVKLESLDPATTPFSSFAGQVSSAKVFVQPLLFVFLCAADSNLDKGDIYCPSRPSERNPWHAERLGRNCTSSSIVSVWVQTQPEIDPKHVALLYASFA